MFAYAVAERSPFGDYRFWNVSGLSNNPRTARIFFTPSGASARLSYCKSEIKIRGRVNALAVILMFPASAWEDYHDALERELK
jgi:hypothetical protein